MKVVVTEKPSVARDIAKVLKASQQKNGYLEGNGYAITWALGHLVQLIDPDKYDDKYKKWRMDTLPIIPERFQKEVIDNRGSKEQFETIQQLIVQEEVTEVICATDAGREGELIFRLIYEQSRCEKPIKRLWISSQTDKAIKEGFDNLKPGEEYVPLFHSASCRSEADWLIGMNASRAYTIAISRGQGVMSVGRVQTPVLKMIVDRYIENQTFKPQTFYELFADCQHKEGPYTGKWFDKKDSRFTDKEKATTIADQVRQIGTGHVTSVTHKEKKEKQPLLYDLTELQKEANRKFKFSADTTLKLMQSLYERHKLLTYPRTSSRYLSKDIEPKLPELVSNLIPIEEYGSIAQGIISQKATIASRMVDDKKVTDHHAIIPTDKKPNLSELQADEFKIYDLVIKRFLAAFLPECVKSHSEIITSFGDHQFKTTGTIIKTPGWREVYAKDAPDTEENDESKGKKAKKKEEPELLLPPVQKGDTVTLQKLRQEEGQTKAPPIHNEASILSAMETAGKTIEDEELKEAMKDCGLGTPATRAQILERLIRVGYITREKNKLIPTPKGEFLIQSIRDQALLSPELTGQWEKKLNDMAQAKYSRQEYMKEMEEFAAQIVDNVVDAHANPNKEALGQCPKCEEGKVVETPRAFSCSNWEDRKCDFTIWKTIAGKVISEDVAKQLLETGETELLEDFRSRKGTTFNAKLKKDDEHNIVFAFDNERKEIGTCPLCEGAVVTTAKAYGCSNWKEKNCPLTIWKTIAGRAISETEAQQLLALGHTEEALTGFQSRAGKPFDAKLILVEGKVQFQFDN